jgi:hypothetical protein
MMGRDDGRVAIAGLHKKFTDRNKLLAFAVNPDQKVSGLRPYVCDFSVCARKLHQVVEDDDNL